MNLLKSYFITLILLFSLSNISLGSVGKDTTAVGTITSFYIYDAIIDSLEIGPSVDSIFVPENGKGYIYYSLKVDNLPNGFDLPPQSVPLFYIVSPAQAYAICMGNDTSGTGGEKFNELCGLILL